MESPQKQILLVRHGTTEYNEKDLLQGRIDNSLSPRGIEEAEQLAKHLRDMPISIFYSSPLKRARQTAEILNSYHQVPIEFIEQFTEIDLGTWEGNSYSFIKSEFSEFHHRWLIDTMLPVPGGESFMQVYERARDGVSKILKDKHAMVAICGHATINRGILGNLLNMNPEAARLFRMRNAALSKIIVYQNGNGFRAVVDFWNYSPLPIQKP